MRYWSLGHLDMYFGIATQGQITLYIVIKMMAKAHMSHKQAVAKVTLKVLLFSWAPIV